MNLPIIGFAGMTHLGLNSAVASAEKGFHVLCFDDDKNLISQLNKSDTSINEPDLKNLLSKNTNNLEFTNAITDLKKCDLVYISLDVPTDNSGTSDLSPVYSMVNLVNKSISEDALLVVLCQVPPGFTRKINRAPDKLYYQVETLIFGRAIERALYPERFIIGCANPANKMDKRYQKYLEAFSCPILPMLYESAELAKTAINLFLAASVSTANTLAEICEKIGADWNEIIPSLKLDKRIGEFAYIAPGLGLSGGNIERDLNTIKNIGYETGAKVMVPTSYIDHSHYRKKWPVRKFFEFYQPDQNDHTVCVLGLAYKKNTHSVKNSPAVELINALPDISINAYDPVVKNVTCNKKIDFANTALEAAKNCDILFIMTDWDEFKSIDWNKIAETMRGKTIIDPYRIVSLNHENQNKFIIKVLGKN